MDTRTDNKLVQARDKLREVLKLVEEIQEGEIIFSAELSQAHADVKSALRALKEHGDAGDWVG